MAIPAPQLTIQTGCRDSFAAHIVRCFFLQRCGHLDRFIFDGIGHLDGIEHFDEFGYFAGFGYFMMIWRRRDNRRTILALANVSRSFFFANIVHTHSHGGRPGEDHFTK